MLLGALLTVLYKNLTAYFKQKKQQKTFKPGTLVKLKPGLPEELSSTRFNIKFIRYRDFGSLNQQQRMFSIALLNNKLIRIRSYDPQEEICILNEDGCLLCVGKCKFIKDNRTFELSPFVQQYFEEVK